MKKILSGFLVIFLLTSCGGDDSTSVDNPSNVDPDTGVFTKIVKTVHESYGDFEVTYDYTNGKLTRISSSFDSDDQGLFYQYNSQGLLSKETLNQADDMPIIVHHFNYDNLGRLSEVQAFSDGVPTGGVTFTYNGNIVTTINTEGVSGNTYILQNDLVIKAIEHDDVTGDSFIEIEYEGSNAISATDGFGSWVFTYDTTYDPAILGLSDGNGAFKANSILRVQNFFDHPLYGIATNYLLSDDYTGSFTDDFDFFNTYTYTFSPGGRPMKVNKYSDGELLSETEYIYEAP